jgi:hypothetical protein
MHLGRAPWWLNLVVEEVQHLMADRRQKARQEDARDNMLPRTHSSDLLPPAMPHFLKFPEPSHIASLCGEQVLKTRVLGDHFITKP